MSLDAMKQALEALEAWNYLEDPKPDADVIAALRAAIEQAQAPVAWVGPSWLHPETRTWESESFAPGPIKGWIPLYTAPRQWQGLTDEEADELVRRFSRYELLRAIETKLKEKNT